MIISTFQILILNTKMHITVSKRNRKKCGDWSVDLGNIGRSDGNNLRLSTSRSSSINRNADTNTIVSISSRNKKFRSETGRSEAVELGMKGSRARVCE